MINQFIAGQEYEIHNLVKAVFDEFVGNGYSEEGSEVFYDFIKPENILNRCNNEGSIFTYSKNDKIVGIIELRGSNHVSQFFVNSNYHHQGIGKQLFSEVLKVAKQNNNDTITVKASPYSEEIYESLGFQKTGEMEEDHGIKYIPMMLNLN